MKLDYFVVSNLENPNNYLARNINSITKPISLDIFEIAQSQEIKVICEGWGANNEISNAINFFDSDFLKKIFIKEILLEKDTTVLVITDENKFWIKKWTYFIKSDFIKQHIDNWIICKDFLKKYVRRAHNASHKHREKWEFYLTPIAIFDQTYSTSEEDLESDEFLENEWSEYLIGVEKSKRYEKYYLWHLIHEIAHHIFNYVVWNNENLKNNRKDICKEYNSNITKYANKETKEDSLLDENFAESFRLLFTNEDYIKSKYPKVYNFIKNNFWNVIKL